MTKVKPTAYGLFKRGFGTDQIAKELGISEAAALKSLTTERSAALKRSSAYPSFSNPWPKAQVAYAGR